MSVDFRQVMRYVLSWHTLSLPLLAQEPHKNHLAHSGKPLKGMSMLAIVGDEVVSVRDRHGVTSLRPPVG